MTTTILSIFLSLLALTNVCFATIGHDRSLASLAEKWNVTDPEFSYSSLGFTLEFIVSDFILDDMISHQIFDYNCAEGGNAIPNTVLNPSLQAEDIPVGEGDNPRRVNATIVINPETVSDSIIYTENVSGGQVTAQVRYCHRFMLTTKGASPIEVNFRETLITLNIDLTDGFEIGEISVAARDQLIETANQVYEVEGYQCNFQNVPLTPAQRLISRSQGSIIRVCVRPDQNARDQGVYMRRIESFTWARDFGGAIGSVTQEAIVDTRPAANQLTILYCESGNEICAFESILMAFFYRNSGSVQGTGVASMQFGSTTIARRGLRSGQARTLQEDGPAAGVAEFDFSMEILPRPSPYASGAEATRTTLWITSVLAVALCLLP
mmetsp:Transcript_118455/g.177017  ORF Transcript_118455/g.177017 Transcript_118455/m.177017 type:complete len:380 (-) Transcript_118455:60-1199(-)